MDIFAQLTKVDVEKREVWGRMAQEVADRSSEIMDYESSKPLFEKWSGDVAQATDGKSLGNVREMHSNVAAGKVISLKFDDAQKSMDIGVKVVDDNSWRKVQEGVFTGFSIGGKYLKKWADGSLTRYTASPSEVSLVDRPCMPSATFFDIVKADGIVQVAFKNQGAEMQKTEKEIQEGAVNELAEMIKTEIVKPSEVVQLIKNTQKPDDVIYADPVNKRYPLGSEEQIRAAWSHLNLGKRAQSLDAELLKTYKEATNAAWKNKIDPVGAPDKAEKYENPALTQLLKQAEEMKKGLYTVSSLSELLFQLSSIQQSCQYEKDYEGDDSTVPAQILVALTQLANALVAMADEETKELLSAITPAEEAANADQLAMSAPTEGLAKAIVDAIQKSPVAGWEEAVTQELSKARSLAKVGARNNATDQAALNAAAFHISKAANHLDSLGANAVDYTDGNDTQKSPNSMNQDQGNNAGANAPVLTPVDTAVKTDLAAELTKVAEPVKDLQKMISDEMKSSLDALLEKMHQPDESLNKALIGIAESQKSIVDRLTKIEAQPTAMPYDLRIATDRDEPNTQPLIKSTPGANNPDAALELTKMALRNPGMKIPV